MIRATATGPRPENAEKREQIASGDDESYVREAGSLARAYVHDHHHPRPRCPTRASFTVRVNGIGRCNGSGSG
ncbi:hypothetical protein E2562_035701 [Oryza meyeriana var. granulata]|uniref:Uncharacterized protein n=1 Tax=Oryza meyeriana var. granulata TaxID=110450 RepID=A0A6G1C3N8_9ORYZ|nr:hypothetical protein E2562_035701 [Oryza meyeriana var. granulata]